MTFVGIVSEPKWRRRTLGNKNEGCREFANPTIYGTPIRPDCPAGYCSAPKILEAIRCQFGIADRVLNVLATEIGLQRSRVMARVGQREAAGMPKHVRVNPEGELGRFARALIMRAKLDGLKGEPRSLRNTCRAQPGAVAGAGRASHRHPLPIFASESGAIPSTRRALSTGERRRRGNLRRRSDS